MRKGGYQILDMHGEDFTPGTGKVIAGIGDAITRSGGKRLVVSGMSIGGTKYPDFEAIFTATDGDDYAAGITGYDISIVASTNTVTVTAQA